MTDFEKKYKLAYRNLYNFHEKHHGASTQSEWQAAANEAAEIFTTKFEIALAAAIYEEIERDKKC